MVETIAEEDFRNLIEKRGRRLLILANYLSRCKSAEEIIVRPLLGELFSQSAQVEELLDTYGARNNSRWRLFRLFTATLKLFSDVSYEILHIRHALPFYRLLPIEKDFSKATDQALLFTGGVLLGASGQVLAQGHQLGLQVPTERPAEEIRSEQLPPGRLIRDCSARDIEIVSKTVTMLATAFLNDAAQSKWIHSAGSARPEEYTSYVPATVSEESLRDIQLRFHNLQSLYDTYVSETETENLDPDLPVLRGHISVVYHLLKTGKSFAHYYERHVHNQIEEMSACQQRFINADVLLGILMSYSVNYASQYLSCAQRLCQAMLKRYAEVGQIEVHAPHYRGFHVRPATLVSKIVLHYGSNVQMELDNDVYDAASPLELFRANEKINASKRRWLAEEIVRLKLVPARAADANLAEITMNVVMTLAEQSKLILYERPLELPHELTFKDRSAFLEQVIDAIAQLLAVGKIDVDTKLKVKFTGDKRVLADIELLANSGYGEDNFGNNIALPEKLVYLRR